MTNVIILHGKPDKWEFYDPAVPIAVDDHWYPWLQKQLLIHDVDAVRVSVPRAFEVTYEDWKREFEKFQVDSESILVGHSCGGGFLLRWLSENRSVHIKKLVLVAPWFDPLDFMKENFGFELFDFERDPDLLSRIQNCVIFHSDDDMESIQQTLDQIKDAWPDMPIREFHAYGHFCKHNLGGQEFPELLEELLN